MTAIVDVSAALKGLTETVPVARTAAGTITLGRVTAGASSALSISASVQPATPEDMKRLPEGQRIDETIKLYTTTELKTVDVDAQTAADRITYDGQVYEVQQVTPWSEVGGYWRVFAKRTGR